MPPVHRFAMPGRMIQVPSDVPDAARWVMEDYIDGTWCGGETAEETFGRQTIRALRSMRPVNDKGPRRLVRVSARWLCLVRNLLDLESLNGDSECDYYAEEGVELDEGGNCLECHWCKSIVLRDRMDYWLDRAGLAKNAYIYDITYDVEETWRRIYGEAA